MLKFKIITYTYTFFDILQAFFGRHLYLKKNLVNLSMNGNQKTSFQ